MYEISMSYLERHIEIIASILLGLLTLSFMFTFAHLTDVVLVCSLLLTALLYKRDRQIRIIYQQLWQEGRPFFILIGLVGIGYMISTLCTGMHRESFTAVRKTVQWMVYPLVLTFFLGSLSQRTDMIIKSIVSGSIIFMCLNLLYQGLVLHVDRPDEWITRYYCNISAGIIASLFFFFSTKEFASTRYYKGLSCIVLILSGATLAILKSRGAFIALSVAISVMLIYGCYSIWKRRKNIFWRGGYILILIGMGLTLLMPIASQDNLVQRTRDSIMGMQKILDGNASKTDKDMWILRSGGDRVYLIKSTLHMIEDYPIFGVGLNQFNTVYVHQGYILPEAKEPDLKSPHNIFMYVLVEAGIVGFIPMILLWLYMIYYTANAIKQKNPLGMAFMLALVVVFVHGLFDYVYFHRPQNQILFFYLAVILLSNSKIKYEWRHRK